ncbi:MAG: 5'/3'-nucleotidase SurE [Anaerolineaceae bacterium]|nr:5'/3'-nucleotidase SurE [Anaerolineaceae bacterium]MBN2677383.1 5'/3'-nucleotidase SurE [Anaerolineaceae bacterium]
MKSKPQILVTNDDGIKSPGLWAVAEALSAVGYVHVVAPRDQSSGTGRSYPNYSDGTIMEQTLRINGQDWLVYAVGGTPAQAVLHAVLEILPHKPDLVVSGINYGENLGESVTASGTVGAAMEAASQRIPALAVSLEANLEEQLGYSQHVNFSTAAYFAALFAKRVLLHTLPDDVDLLKVDVPQDATKDTPCVITQQARHGYYYPRRPDRDQADWNTPVNVSYEINVDPRQLPVDTDIYTVLVKKQISVTPLSLNLTSRVNPEELKSLLGM